MPTKLLSPSQKTQLTQTHIGEISIFIQEILKYKGENNFL